MKKIQQQSLRKYLKNIEEVDDFEIKRLRTKYLWDLVRSYVKRIKLMILLRGINYNDDVRFSMDFKHMFEEQMIDQGEDDPGTIWQVKCLVKKNSNFYVVWSLIQSLELAGLFSYLPFVIGSNYLILLSSVLNHQTSFQLQFVYLILDFLFNIVVQQPINVVSHTVYMNESIKAYACKYMIIDIIVIIQIAILAFSDTNFINRTLTRYIFKQLIYDNLERLEKSEINSGKLQQLLLFNDQSNQNYKLIHSGQEMINDSKGKGGLNILIFAIIPMICKLTRIGRVARGVNIFKFWIQQMAFIKDQELKKKILDVFEVVFILLKMVFIIHFITSFWMLQADQIRFKMATIFLNYLDKLMNFNQSQTEFSQNIEDDISQVYFNQFYLILMTLTVVGYGDPVSIPDYENYKQDLSILLVCMLFGFLGFQQIQAQLLKFLSRQITQGQNSRNKQMGLIEQIDEFFVVYANKPINAHFNWKETEQFKVKIVHHYHYNYQQLIDDSFLNELPPNIKKQLQHVVLQKECINFKYLFYDYLQMGEESQLRLMMNQNTIYKLITSIEFEEVLVGKINKDQLMVSGFKQEFKYFYMLKKGRVEVLSEEMESMFEIESGSFIGEFNILFGILNLVNFRITSNQNSRDACQLYKIEKQTFLKIIGSDFEAFKHLFNVSLQKYRFYKKMKSLFKLRHERKVVYQQGHLRKQERYFRYQRISRIQINQKEKDCYLFDIIDLTRCYYPKSQYKIHKFLDDLMQDRIKKMQEISLRRLREKIKRKFEIKLEEIKEEKQIRLQNFEDNLDVLSNQNNLNLDQIELQRKYSGSQHMSFKSLQISESSSLQSKSQDNKESQISKVPSVLNNQLQNRIRKNEDRGKLEEELIEEEIQIQRLLQHQDFSYPIQMSDKIDQTFVVSLSKHTILNEKQLKEMDEMKQNYERHQLLLQVIEQVQASEERFKNGIKKFESINKMVQEMQESLQNQFKEELKKRSINRAIDTQMKFNKEITQDQEYFQDELI